MQSNYLIPFFLALVVGSFSFVNVFAATAVSEKKNCTIRIEYYLKNGESASSEYGSAEKNKQACAKAAKLHEENFAPQSVKKKKVTYSWIGKNEKK